MYIILGVGIQAKAIIQYILQATNGSIISFDETPNKSVLKDIKYSSEEPRWEHRYEDWTKMVSERDRKRVVVISCLPTNKNPDVASICALFNWNYIDLGGKLADTEVVIDKICMNLRYTSIAVPDCGVAPGLVSSIAGNLYRAGAKTVRLYAGGLPLNPSPPLNYIKAFNPAGVYKEYTGVAERRKNKKLEYIPTLSYVEQFYGSTRLGELEASPTSGSISFAARELPLQNLSYLTLRYPGHWRYVKENIMFQPNPIEIIDKMSPEMNSNSPDLLILSVSSNISIKNEIDSRGGRSISWIWDYDHKNNIGAMSQITGYTVGAVAEMIHNGDIKNRQGIVHMHEVDFLKIKESIMKMPNQFEVDE